MHKLTLKQPHENILILQRYRTNGHNTGVFYHMRETAIVYITCNTTYCTKNVS